jgi:hypothetical protein
MAKRLAPLKDRKRGEPDRLKAGIAVVLRASGRRFLL